MKDNMAEDRVLGISSDVLSIIPRSAAVEFRLLPMELEGDVLKVAVLREPDRSVLSDVAFATGKKIQPCIMEEEELKSLFLKYYNVGSFDLPNERTRQSEEDDTGTDAKGRLLPNGESPTAKGSAGFELGAGSTIALADKIIAEAVKMKASDIHIEPYERNTRVRYRIDGMLHEVLRPSLEQSRPLISRLKIMADLDIAEKRRPQDGRIRVKDGHSTIDIRVSSLATDFGEKIVLRILDKSQLRLDLNKLGFEDEQLVLFRKAVKLPYGMILVTGPTGSGKTTTLYAALNEINRPEINITTIEDPIEYNLDGINQTHVHSEIGVTFAAALRSILRQDPNVIMVGEIRDNETAEIAIRAALTGHLVLSTLHTNDAPSAVTRLIDMGVEPFLVASSVKLILAQRLLRKLCAVCRRTAQPAADLLGELGTRKLMGRPLFGADGCSDCNSFGYKGRTAAYEVLMVDDDLAESIARGATASQLREMAVRKGMVFLREVALRKAFRGETSLDEVIRETVA